MKINRRRVPPDGSALAEAVVDAGLDLIRGEPSTLFLLRAAEAHRLPGAYPIDEQVAVVCKAERYLAAAAHGLANRGIKGAVTGV